MKKETIKNIIIGILLIFVIIFGYSWFSKGGSLQDVTQFKVLKNSNPLNSLSVLDHVSTEDFNVAFIVAAQIRTENQQTCGNGNSFIDSCSFFKDYDKVHERGGDGFDYYPSHVSAIWPDDEVLAAYPELFDSNNYYQNNSLEVVDDGELHFESQYVTCGLVKKQIWSVDTNTFEFSLVDLEEEVGEDCGL